MVSMVSSEVFNPRTRSSWGEETSIRTTSMPDCANTWAIPLPMVPAPTTAAIIPSFPARTPSEERARRRTEAPHHEPGHQELAEVDDDERRRSHLHRGPETAGQGDELRDASGINHQQSREQGHGQP